LGIIQFKLVEIQSIDREVKRQMKKILALFLIISLIVSVAYADKVDEAIRRLEGEGTRKEAIRDIEKIGKPAGPSLIRTAKDESKDQNTRISAIMLLGKIKAEQARDSLEEILEKDEDKFCREASAIGLGRLEDKRARPKLKQALSDKSGNVRMRAAWALAKIGDGSGYELALETIKGKDVTAQLLAIDALEAIGNKEAIPILKQNLESENVWTRIHSKLAIKRLEMLGLSEIERLNFLKETLKDEQFEVNNWAAIELGKIALSDIPESQLAIDILRNTVIDSKLPGSYAASKIVRSLIELGKIKGQ